ncbi:MAG: restriction endonuclease subunit S [Veillonella dispar]|nr:restriction endonuclease subunit S [Veillonella dispar]
MMSKEKRRVPKLRFPGFTEDWEQRKFSDLYEKISEKNDLSYSLNKIISVANMYYKSDAKVSNEEYLKTYNIFRYGEIAFEGNKSKDFAYGRFVENTIGDGIISHVFEVFRPIVKYDIYYWKYYINYEPIMGKVLSRCTKKTTMMTNLVAKDFLKETVLVPTLAEQKQIGTLLNTLDKFITLHQRKLDNLRLKKKALLQKLFPKNGERYPELRFPGFTDAWEQRKLGECMDSFEYGLNAAAKEYDGTHKYIRITDIDDETHNFIQSNLTSPDIDFNSDVSDYKLNINDIVFARTGASVGKTYLYNPSDGDLYYAGFLIRGKVNEACDAGFIYQNTLTRDYDSFIRITSQRSGQPGVNSKEYATFRLNIPCKDEQEKISELLNRLDKLFTLHQRKLDHLQLKKKALLQQMFV